MGELCQYSWMGSCDNEATHIAVLECPAGLGTFTKNYCKDHGEWVKGCGNFVLVQKIEIITLQACPRCNPKHKNFTLHKTKVIGHLIFFVCEECKARWVEERKNDEK